MILYDESLKIFHSTLIPQTAFVSGFGTRQTGDGRQRSNVATYFRTNTIGYRSLIVPEQIHSVNVEIIPNEGDIVRVIDSTDGVITSGTGVMLTVITADCVPIIFANAKGGVIGISHQGWRGSLKRMVVKMLHTMTEIGSDTSTVRVAIGPSINGCCYKIYGDRYYEFLAEFEMMQDKIFLKNRGAIYLSLPRLNYWQLIDAGVKKEHIDFFPFCTHCDKNRFFSFQRDDKSHYGEMFSFIMKK